MSDDLKEVPCPCCRRPLYVLIKVTKGDSIWLVTENSPRVENDNKGPFIKCPSCSKRVAMEPDISLQGSGFHVAPVQRCDETLP